ncbi:DUF6600 domain-containing protein [Pedobacter chinensis]|uniref:DUF6600 domain-containing protein n=1 Tax=Pedobacter chinensis TaxID=2282421 RepID=UPI0018F5441B|nr:DUF6600 domain-containing protein [Pedobacter chinensis]
MKTLKKSAIVLGLFALLAGTTTLVRAQDYRNDYQDDGYSTGNISLQTFYDELSPYGTWIQDPQYGYVWRPDVDQNEFRPYYTNGRWAMTEYGNTWVSNYDWGWAPFHYGRWVINSYRQWIWLPDTVWGPAWVDWRSGDGYYGWAPMAPTISINLSFGRRYVVPAFCWNFIPQRNIYITSFPRYDYGRNNVYIRNTTIINNTYVYNRRTYYGGPRIEDIRRATNREVTVYRYAQSNRPGASRVGGKEVSIYRPRPERNADNRNAAPRKYEQGNVGISRGNRSEGYANRDQRGGNNNDRSANNDNRLGSRNDNRDGQPNRGNDANVGRDNNQPNNRGEAYNRNSNGRIERGNASETDQRNREENANRGQNQQRSQQDRMNQNQQRAQRDVRGNEERSQEMQRQRSQEAEQQRAQRNEQMQQQRSQQMEQQRAQQAQAQQQERAQRDARMQQQRSQQMEQQRAQRDAQMQQQRNQQAEQQRAQREAQVQQQRAQQQQQMQQRQEQRRTEAPQQQRGGGERSGSEGGRPSRGGRG